MVTDPVPVYVPHSQGGINLASSRGDGSTIAIEWDRAYPSTSDYQVAYNIYYSSILEDVFTEGVKFVSIDDGYLNACILQLTPGDIYYFAVKAVQYDPAWFNLSLLPDGFPDLKTIPEGMLLTDMTTTDLAINVSDIDLFPAYGVAQVGAELMRYSSKDIPSSTLIVSERGFQGTNIRLHQTDGYDGVAFQDPLVRFWDGFLDKNFLVHQETASFAFPNAAFTVADGYAGKTDKITTDLTGSDESLADVPEYDYVGWHRTDPLKLVNGECIGTYIGGEQFCADGYLGVGRQLRGVSLVDQALRREEALLRTTGNEVMLVRRLWSGKRCPCALSTVEHPDKRCPKCFGTGFSTGYDQFFNPRRSDGRILVQFGPADETFQFESAGLESKVIIDCWTMGFPAVKDWDFIIRYNEDGTEEFRYEVVGVTRNTLFNGQYGAQKFKVQRVRRTSPIYMWKAISTTAMVPTTVITSIGMMAGPGGTTLLHTHDIVINEGIVSLAQVNQTTSVSEGHNHEIRDGVVQEEFGHTHTIVIP